MNPCLLTRFASVSFKNCPDISWVICLTFFGGGACREIPLKLRVSEKSRLLKDPALFGCFQELCMVLVE